MPHSFPVNLLRTTVGRFFAACFAILTLIGTASAVEFSTVEIEGKRVTVCRVNIRKERLQLFHRDENGQPLKRFERLSTWLQKRGEKLVFAMNAGMYHGDFSAVGLSVSDGKQLTPLNTNNGEGNFSSNQTASFSLPKKARKSSNRPNTQSSANAPSSPHNPARCLFKTVCSIPHSGQAR